MSEPMARVYRCFDGDDRLLYVGVSGGPEQRLKDHARKSPWFGDVARVAVTPLMPRRAALDAEYEAIRSERPVHNKQPRQRVELPPIEVVS